MEMEIEIELPGPGRACLAPTVDGAPIAPYPYHFPGPARLVARLASTRSGLGAAWRLAPDLARGVVNDAPYNPVLRAEVTDFTWSPPAAGRDRDRAVGNTASARPDGSYAVVQSGSGILNWAALTAVPIPDPHAWILGAPRPDVPSFLQGALAVYYPLREPAGPLPEVPLAGPGYRWFYNHLIFPCIQFVYRVRDGVAVAYARLPEGGTITSPDHPDESIQVAGWVVLTHPVPTSGTSRD